MIAWRLLLTRPQSECVALADVLSANGIVGHCLPLLDIEPLPETALQRSMILELDRYAAVIAISKPAARLGFEQIDRYWPQLPHAQRWFAVGPGTAAVLEHYGVEALWPEGKDSEALLTLPALKDALSVMSPRVLILRGEGGRDVLQAGLEAQGSQVDSLVLYRRVLPDGLAGEPGRLVEAERLNGLVVSSGQGLEHLQRVSGAAWKELSALTLFVPGARVAALAREAGCQRIVDCRGASNEALLAALATCQPED
jgi:uroporphyrinogen-III synthase